MGVSSAKFCAFPKDKRVATRPKLVVIWLLVATSTASEELPSPSDVLGSYLPPSNSYKSSEPKDSFQHLNFGLPSSPKVVFSPESSPSASKGSSDHDSAEGGRYDFSNFNFNIPKSVYTEPKEEQHSSSSEEVSSVGKDYAPVRSGGERPEETVRQTQSKDVFTISKHSSQREDIVPDENGMVCIPADLYYKLKSQAENKIPCAASGQRKETVEIKTSIESSKPNPTYFSSQIAGEPRVTHKQPEKSVTPDQVGYELPKPSYESPTHLTSVSKPTSTSTRKETDFDLNKPSEKKGDRFFAGKPQVPNFFSVVSKDAPKANLGYKTPAKTPDTTEIKLSSKKSKPSYSNGEHSIGGSGKTLYHPSGQVEPKKTTHTGGYSYQSTKSNSDGDGRERKPDSHFGIGSTPSLKGKTSEYKTPGSCCQIVKSGESHPDSVFSLITKSKPFTVQGDTALKGESEESLSTSLFFKTPGTKPTYTGSRANIQVKENDTGLSSFTPLKNVHQISKVSKEIPYFTNNISQQKVEVSKSPHFIQGTNDEGSDEDDKPYVGQSPGFPEQISTIPSQVQKTKPKITPLRSVDIFGSPLKSKEESHDSDKNYRTVVKSEIHGKSKPTISASSSKSDSDETYQKKLKQPVHSYKSVKEQPRGAKKFPPTLTSTANAPKTIPKTSTPSSGRTYIAPKSPQSLPVGNFPGFKDSDEGSQAFRKSSPDTFPSKEIPSIFKSPSITFGKSEQTKEILPVTKDKKGFSTHLSASSEETKGKHAVTQRGGSYHTPSSSSKLPELTGSQKEDSVGSSDFFKIPTASRGSLSQQHGDVLKSPHKQTPTRKIELETKHNIPSGSQASSHPGHFSGTFTKITHISDKSEDDARFGGGKKPLSEGHQPNRGIGEFSGPFSKIPLTSNKDEIRKHGLDEGYKTSSRGNQPLGISSKTHTSGKVHEKSPGVEGNDKSPSKGSQPGTFTSPFTKTIQSFVKDDDKRPISSGGFRTSIRGGQPSGVVNPFSKKISISNEDKDKIPKLGGSYNAPSQGTAADVFTSSFPQTTLTSNKKDEKKTGFKGRYNAPSQGTRPSKKPKTVAGSFLQDNKGPNDGNKQVGIFESLQDSTLGNQPRRFGSTFSKTTDTSDEDDDKAPSIGGRYKAPSQVTIPISQPGRVTTIFPKSALISKSDEDKTTGFGDKYRGSSQGQPIRQPGHFASTFSKIKDTTKEERSKSKDAGRTYPTTSTISVGNPVSLSSDQSKSDLSSSTPKYKSPKVQGKLKPSQTQRFRGTQPTTAPKPQINEPSQNYQSPKASGSLHLSGHKKKTDSGEQPVGQPTQSRGSPQLSETRRGVGKTPLVGSGSRGKNLGGTYSSPSKASPSNQSQKSTSVKPPGGSTDSSGQTASKMKMMMPYNFEWKVNDANTNNDFGQKASSDGMVEKGEYHVVLPDGRKQVVTYLADWETGYHVNVKYENTKIAPGRS